MVLIIALKMLAYRFFR